jgi:UDP-N-acetylglucosamine 2-epimerase (non-hydrolysing)
VPKPLVLVVLGTRPEAIKLAPVVRALKRRGEVRCRVCVTGQHRELLDQMLRAFALRPADDLALMRPDQGLNDLLSKAVARLGALIRKTKPALVLVQGDTTTALAAALAAFHERVPVGHVEAGLRTFDNCNPFPEELNRATIDALAALRFAPTAQAARNLRAPGGGRVLITGNTVIDSLRWVLAHPRPVESSALRRALAAIKPGDAVALATAHRRESQGGAIEGFFRAFDRLAAAQPRLHVLFPVHPSPRVREAARRASKHPRVHRLPPLGYFDLVEVLRRSRFVMTDSGGLIEEAAALGKPTLILRRVTERPEAVRAGVARVAGVAAPAVFALAMRLLDEPAFFRSMAKPTRVFGDGRAAQRIARAIGAYLAG